MTMFVGRSEIFSSVCKDRSKFYSNHCYGFVKLTIRSSFWLSIYFDAIFENIYFELSTSQNVIKSKHQKTNDTFFRLNVEPPTSAERRTSDRNVFHETSNATLKIRRFDARTRCTSNGRTTEIDWSKGRTKGSTVGSKCTREWSRKETVRDRWT